MQEEQKFGKLFFISLLFHVGVLCVLIMSFEFNSKNYVLENSKDQIIDAMVLEETKIQRANPKPVAPSKPKEVVKKIKPPKPEPVKSITPPKPIEPPKPEPVITKAEPVVKKDVIAIDDKKKKQKEVEKQLLADLQQIKKAQKAKKHKDLEKEFAKELQQMQAAKSLERELAKEESQLASSKAQKMRGIVDKYKAQILQSIAQHWLVPPGVDKTLSCELRIKVAAGGSVLDVRLVRSSGDDALDRSARSAVFKASPLPVPSDPDDFEPFKEFILKVKPENVSTRDSGLG